MFTTSTMLSSKSCIAQRPQAFVQARTAAPRVEARMTVVASAKLAKASALRTEFTTTESIDQEVERIRAEMFTARIKFAKREEYKPAQYKALRKRVAQLLTIKRERELAQGITARESRAAEKRKLVEAGLGKF